MKVTLVSTSDTGGAGIAANRLHLGINRLGGDSTLFVADRQTSASTISEFEPATNFAGRLKRRYRRAVIDYGFSRYTRTRPPGLELFTDDRSPFGTTVLDQLPAADIINIHWIARFLDYQAFFAGIPPNRPVIWTLHDMNPFTGGCHYVNGCERYRAECGACPQLGSTVDNDLSRQIWRRKKQALADRKPGTLRIVTPSKWLAREAGASSLFSKYPIDVIPNGLDTEAFAPRDRMFSREVLGIPMEAKVLLFCAGSLGNDRKGFSLLSEVLTRVGVAGDVCLLSVGRDLPLSNAPYKQIHLGSIQNERCLSLAYSSADLFVLPSLEDNLPNTMLEAIACGTPVVGFAAGGIPDAVREGETGSLAEVGNVRDMAAKISALLDNPSLLQQMGANGRRVALTEYALEIQAKRYVELYDELAARE